MIFRGRQPEATVWRRFRSGYDHFTFGLEGDVYVARIVANAERVLDLFHALSANLSPAVDVALEDERSGRGWRGEAVALPDVRDVIARLKLPLSVYGGVELAVYTTDDQITLSPGLELFVYARSDRWLYILLGKGLVEQDRISGSRWDADAPLTSAPELATALDQTVERLGLEPVTHIETERDQA
ncbi:MAG TPA: hypothetical protein VGE02_05850 [Gemmatimonadales bacterium]